MLILSVHCAVFAQVSLGKYKETPNNFTQVEKISSAELNNKLSKMKGLTGVKIDYNITSDSLIKRLKNDISDTVDLYEKKRLFILNDETVNNKEKEPLITSLIKVRDSLINEKKDLIQIIKHWKRYERHEEPKQLRNFFPAYYSSQAVRFFEDDSVHRKLFQNNLVNYNPGTKKMVLYTEAVNDYFGPFRAGIGFQVKTDAKVDSLSTADSTKKLEKKTDMLSAVQNGGGDLSFNLKYPIKKSSSTASGLQYLVYVYGNTGFSLPVLNKATDDFLFNYDAGVEAFVYMKGFNNRITLYYQFKGAYYGGNKNYKKVITDADKNDPTSFVMFQNSFGLDFMDG